MQSDDRTHHPMPYAMTIKNCAELTDAELTLTRNLTVSETQQEFGGSFQETLDACLLEPKATTCGLCFFVDQAPVGIVLLKRPPCAPDWVSPQDVSLHALKIDQGLQGRGLGKAALTLSAKAALQMWPDAAHIVLSVDAGNAAALALYRRFGMTDSGSVFKGRLGYEHRLSKRLAAPGMRL